MPCVYARQTRSQSAGQLVGNGIKPGCAQSLKKSLLAPSAPIKCDHIALFGLRYVGNIKEHLVHADAADLIDCLAHEQTFHLIRKAAIDAVGITNRDGGQFGRPLGFPV